MAGFREHVGFSSLLGFFYGLSMLLVPGISYTQAILGGLLTSFGGMLPDLDSETGKPTKEMFSLLGAILPVMFSGRLLHTLGLAPLAENILLIYVLGYFAVRHGGAWVLGKIAVHRGMFHSIPALAIASQITFLCFPGSDLRVRGLMAVGIGVGFLSHLVLDEIYSVKWNGLSVKLAKSSGSALKFFGPDYLANIITLGLMFTLSYGVYGEFINQQQQLQPAESSPASTIYMIGKEESKNEIIR